MIFFSSNCDTHRKTKNTIKRLFIKFKNLLTISIQKTEKHLNLRNFSLKKKWQVDDKIQILSELQVL